MRYRNAVATGLHGTSLDLRFSTHAISSRAEINTESAPDASAAESTLAILDDALSPAYFSSWRNTGSEGSDGRDAHRASIGEQAVSSVMPWRPNMPRIRSTAIAENTIPSTPTDESSAIASQIHSSIVGVSSRPSFISFMPVPSSCCAAWIK